MAPVRWTATGGRRVAWGGRRGGGRGGPAWGGDEEAPAWTGVGMRRRGQPPMPRSDLDRGKAEEGGEWEIVEWVRVCGVGDKGRKWAGWA